MTGISGKIILKNKAVYDYMAYNQVKCLYMQLKIPFHYRGVCKHYMANFTKIKFKKLGHGVVWRLTSTCMGDSIA